MICLSMYVYVIVLLHSLFSQADRVKQLVSHARYGRHLPINDPYAALQRDARSATLLGISSSSSSDDAALLKAITEGPMMALEAVVAQHRNSHVKLIQAMQDAEARHNKVRCQHSICT